MIDAQEEVQASYEDPFANMKEYSSAQTYTRYEITAAWSSILSSIANDGDYVFAANLAGSTLETGDVNATPFPVRLVYVGNSANADIWNYKQMQEHPEHLERVKRILEDRLQTQISLSLGVRAYTETELEMQRNARLTPYERDLQSDPHLSKLQQLFATELIFSHKLSRNTLQAQTDEEEPD